MDTMKLLLGATIALLLGALAVSWQGMNTGVKNASAGEIARLEKQVKELRVEQDKLTLERQMQQLRSETPQQPTTSAAADIAAIRAQMEAQAAERMAVEEKARADREKKALEEAEEGFVEGKKLEKGDTELRRARMISEALLIGRVKEFVEDAQYGGFITFDVLMPEQVQTGTIVAIRRKTGILGQLKVSDVTAEGAIANPLPGFGPVQPKIGDELILPPQY